MSDHNRPNPDDLLETSLAALRSEQLPAGPSARTVADTLSALRRAEARPKLWQWVIHMTLTQKIAATIALTLGGLTIYFVLSLFGGFASISYAQVANQIRAVRSMSCTITVQGANVGKLPVPMQMMFMDPGKTRMQMLGTRMVVITDAAAHRILMLNESDKTATVTNFTTINAPADKPDAGKHDFIEQFKKLADGKGEPAPDRQIGQIKAKGFHVPQGGYDAVVYADPKSGVPLEVDFEHIPGADRVSMGDFHFDANLDPALFSVTPPDGYKVVSQKMTLNLDLAEDVAPVLKAYSAHKDGRFPPQLTDFAEIITALHPDAPKPDAEMQKLFGDMGAVTALLSQYHRGTEWDYLPASVKLGDADKIVFWYQPKGSTTYKAVYGDLRIAEVTADQLPPHPSKAATTSPTPPPVSFGPPDWAVSGQHLHMIGIALGKYVKENGAYPDALSNLKSDDMTPETLTCPVDGKPYVYRKPATADVSPRTVVAFEAAPSRKVPEMVNILCADGDVEGFPEVDAKAIIAKGER